MDRETIITELKKYFKLQELVCPHVMTRHGEKAWMFLSTPFLHTLLIIRRDIIQKPMIINNHRVGGNFTQRGLRCNICQIVKDKTNTNVPYLSAHVLGQGCDSHCNGISAEEMRRMIIAKKHLLPYPIRIERSVNWLHFDMYDPTNGKEKIVMFNG